MQTQHKFISRFSPNRTDPEDLERINVQREDLLTRSLAAIRESVLTENKHHLLFIGPRGSGKSHLLALIAHRLQGQSDLADSLRIAWLNEDETSTSFLDLLLRIYRALAERYPAEFPIGEMERLTGRERPEALDLLCGSLVARAAKRTILVMLENLDALFSQLEESDQRAWRAFIQNHPIFATIATAQSLFAGVSERDEPFFGFFDTTPLQPFTVQEATELLQRIAQLNNDTALVEFLATPRGKARVQAIHHLSGGNPRLYIVLSDFITRQSLDELVRPFEGMVDEQLTPYYQERLRWLSPQQRKIVEFLCLRGRPVPVKDIAAALFAEQASIAGQLQKLREMRYVKPNPRGRETLYELAEPLMRLSMEVKNTRNHQPLRLLVDFLRVWFERDELERLSVRCEPGGLGRDYVSAALEKVQRGEPDLRRELLLQGIGDLDIEHCDVDQLEGLRLLSEDSDRPVDWLNYAWGCYAHKRFLEAAEALSKVLDVPGLAAKEMAFLLTVRGRSLEALGRTDEALADFTRVIELPGAPVESVGEAFLCRGFTLDALNRTEEAVADFTQTIALSGAPPELLARALSCRGAQLYKADRIQEALADCTRVAELPKAPGEALTGALILMGTISESQGQTREAIAIYTRAIESAGVPTEGLALALISRGSSYDTLKQNDDAIADYTRAIKLPGASAGQVAKALLKRSRSQLNVGRIQEATRDLAQVIELPGALREQIAMARGGIVFLRLIADDWGMAQEQMAKFIGEHPKPIAITSAVTKALVAAISRRIASPEIWPAVVVETISLYAKHELLPQLGDALVRHLSELAESRLSGEGLDQWLAGWESAGAGHSALQLPLRLLRAGIAYLKTEPRDEGVLLQLPSEERTLLRQALGLESEPPK